MPKVMVGTKKIFGEQTVEGIRIEVKYDDKTEPAILGDVR